MRNQIFSLAETLIYSQCDTAVRYWSLHRSVSFKWTALVSSSVCVEWWETSRLFGRRACVQASRKHVFKENKTKRTPTRAHTHHTAAGQNFLFILLALYQSITVTVSEGRTELLISPPGKTTYTQQCTLFHGLKSTTETWFLSLYHLKKEQNPHELLFSLKSVHNTRLHSQTNLLDSF